MARRLSVLKDAIAVVLRSLAALPPSPEVEELKAKAEKCLDEVKGWSQAPPVPEDRDRISKSVLKVHTEAAKLARQAWGA